MTRFQKTATRTLALALAVLTLSVVGCKKSSSPVETTTIPITTDIFPLTVGHKITYTGYLRSIGTDTTITSGGTVYSSTWTVASNSTTTPLGFTSNLIIDSITAPIPSASLLYVLRDPPTGDANFSFIQTVNFRGADTLVWVLTGDIQDGVGAYWGAFVDSSRILDSTSGVLVDSTYGLIIAGHIADQESLTVGGQSFTTYRLLLTHNDLADGLVQGEPDIPIATYWFSPGIGPVKIIVNATKQSTGYEWDFQSKNF